MVGGLGERVRFLGQVPRAAMPERYRSATVLVVTSRHEGQSMVAVEAAASGLPVVGTRVGVLPDLGGGAVTVAPDDASGLADAIGSVLDDAGRAAAMGAAGRRWRWIASTSTGPPPTSSPRYEGLVRSGRGRVSGR